MSSYLNSLLTGYFRIFFQVAIAIFLTPFILKYISKEEYGIYALIQSTIGFLALVDFGFSGALNVLISRNTNNPDKVSIYSSITGSFQLFLGFLGLLFGLILSQNFTLFFKIENSSLKEIKIVILLFSIGFLINMMTQVYASILRAYRQIHIDNIIGIISVIVNFILIVIFLLIGYGLIGLASTVVISQFLIAILSFYRVRKYFPKIKVKYFKIDKGYLIELFKLGIWFFIGSLSVLFIERFDQVLTGGLISIETVAVLVITAKLFELSRKLIYTLSNNFRPYFGKLIEDNKLNEAYTYYKLLRRWSLLSAIFIASTIIYLNEAFISLWVGNEFYGGRILTFVLGMNLLYYCWKLPSRAYLSANLVVKEQSISGIFEGVINVALSYFLGKTYGVVGIVAGTFIVGFFIQLFVYGVLLERKSLEKLRTYFQVNFELFLQALLFFVITYFFQERLPINSDLSLLNFLKLLLFFICCIVFLTALNWNSLRELIKLRKSIRVVEV